MFIVGAGISPSSRTPRGIATTSGKSSDSNQVGDPQSVQKHLSPFPELNFRILPRVTTVSFDRSAIAHVAGAVPANFVQLAQ